MMKTGIRGIVISLIIVGALLVSGCGGGANYSTTAGVQINNMDFDFPKISDDDGEIAYLSLELQNVGSKQMAGDGHYWIYGPTIKSGTSRDPYVWVYSDGTPDKDLDKDLFYPPEPNMEGAKETVDIALHPPDIPAGMTDSSTFYTRICYPYTTTALFKLYSPAIPPLTFWGTTVSAANRSRTLIFSRA